MTDITTHPVLPASLPRRGFPGFKLPKPTLRLSLAPVFAAIGEAFALAYVAPYESRPSRPPEHEI